MFINAFRMLFILFPTAYAMGQSTTGSDGTVYFGAEIIGDSIVNTSTAELTMEPTAVGYDDFIDAVNDNTVVDADTMNITVSWSVVSATIRNNAALDPYADWIDNQPDVTANIWIRCCCCLWSRPVGNHPDLMPHPCYVRLSKYSCIECTSRCTDSPGAGGIH